ncbi:MAG: FapA family protein [Spirochaetales bacterium]|nr:FapA family protein [Spirochaetales bacterium]
MDLSDLKNFMKQQAEVDKKKQETQVSGTTLENALNNASMELGLPIKHINYEILQKGNSGVLGIGKKEWLIIAYASVASKKVSAMSEDSFDVPGMEDIQIEEDVNARFFIRLNDGIAKLKVEAPKGAGKELEQKLVEDALLQRGVNSFKKDKVKSLIRNSDGKYHEVGSYIHNTPADTLLDITMDSEDMKATLIFTPPGHGGDDVLYETILDYLSQHGIVFGIQEETIKNFVDSPDYAFPLDAALGKLPINGSDAYVEYLFETDRQHLTLEEVDGRVDFKNMKMIQNVREGDILAKKHPLTQGENGSTVLGKMLPAKPGKDIVFEAGENAEIVGDEIRSSIDGQVFLLNNKVTVDPVYLVKGDVCLKTGGNIDFLGTVIVKGSVEDGFSVKATKNIEIAGTVGKCNIQAGGDLMVSQGINGRDGGLVESKGSIFAKFIENAHVKADLDVVVHDGIVNSVVDAKGMVKCHSGKRAAIVGGVTRATQGLLSKTLGTIAGSETVVEVGFDPEKRERYLELETLIEQITSELSDVSLNVNTLLKTSDRGGLTEEKKESLKRLRSRQEELNVDLSNFTEEYNSIKEYLESLKSGAEVAVEGKVFAGVKLNISGAEMRVRNEIKLVTFYKEGPVVKIKIFAQNEK